MKRLLAGVVILDLIIGMVIYDKNENKNDVIEEQRNKIELQKNYSEGLEYQLKNKDDKNEKLEIDYKELENKYQELNNEHQQLENKYQKVIASNKS